MDVLKWARAQWDRVGAWGAVGIGALLLLIGWLGVSRTAYPAEQIPYVVSAGLGGILLVGLGATLWISHEENALLILTCDEIVLHLLAASDELGQALAAPLPPL